jgi:hypothetical protein
VPYPFCPSGLLLFSMLKGYRRRNTPSTRLRLQRHVHVLTLLSDRPQGEDQVLQLRSPGEGEKQCEVDTGP